MCKLYADYILTSDSIFTGLEDSPFRGYVATADERILKVGRGSDYQSLVGEKTTVIDCGGQMITPGFIDVHTFFTGYAIFHIGMDVSEIDTVSECMERLQNYALDRQPDSTLFGHGWNPEKLEAGPVEEKLNQNYPERAVILFAANRGTCIMNQKAREVYGFTPEECYPEAYHKIMREYLNDRAFIEPEFQDYMKLMNSRGVTTVKEMGFDDFYGFLKRAGGERQPDASLLLHVPARGGGRQHRVRQTDDGEIHRRFRPLLRLQPDDGRNGGKHQRRSAGTLRGDGQLLWNGD